MDTPEAWCTKIVEKLHDDDLRISTLNEIQSHFDQLPENELSQTANLLELPLVFDCLNDSDKEQIDLACDVLTKCMENLTLGDSIKRYGLFLERALNHPHKTVKLMALTEIERNLNNDDMLVNITKRVSLLNNLIKCIGIEDISVAKVAEDIITHIGVTDNGINQLLSDSFKDSLVSLMSTNETVKLRVYEIFTNISKESASGQKLIESKGFWAQILKELENNDVLLRMNIIELLSQLVVTKHGYLFLESQGVMNKFLKTFLDDSDPLFVQICEPGILKFFGHLAHSRPSEVLNKYSYILTRITTNIECGDEILAGVSLDTLGYIASKNEGKLALDATGDCVLNIVSGLTEKMNSFTTLVRLRALTCIENLLRVESDDKNAIAIAHKWYLAMGTNPMDWIMKYAKNPFAEIRCTGLSIVSAISTQTWGQEVILNTPGLLEFLFDRNVETAKDAKELKYDIIKNLSGSSIFDHHTQLRLQTFVKEGPFYVRGITEVATQGDD